MKKLILLFFFLSLSFSLLAQYGLIANTVNTADSTFSLYQQGSPSNLYGNRIEYLHVSKNRIKIYSGKLYLDSSTFANDGDVAGKFLSANASTGKIEFCPKASLTIPYSQLTQVPTIPPVGVIVMYGASTSPSGYLLCNGSTVSRTTYVGLFTVVGTTYGIGDGSTTFNLPDLRQRFPLGIATSGTGSVLGSVGGSIDHIHSIDPPSTTTGSPSGTVAATILAGGAASTTHTHNVDISAFNSATSNPPYQVVNYIIKY